MPIALTSLLLHVQSDTKDAEAGLGRVGDGVRHLDKTMGITSLSMTGGMALIGTAVMGVVGTLKGWVLAAEDSESKAAAINAVLVSTHGAAGLTAKALTDLASKTLILTGIDDEAVLGAEKMLLTFTNIGHDVFPQATQAVTNLATSMNNGLTPSASQLQQTAIQVGKALNDPIKGVGALMRVGVSFTAQQKEQIKEMVKSGHAMEAQKLILKELNTEFGGAAEAAGHTFGGSIARLDGLMHNLKETMGGAIIPLLNDLLAIVTPLVSSFGEFLNSRVIPLADVMEKRFNTALKTADSLFNKLAPSALHFIKAVESLANLIGKSLAGAFDASNPKFSRFRDTVDRTASLSQKLSDKFMEVYHLISRLDWNKALEPLARVAERVSIVVGSGLAKALSQLQQLWLQLKPSVLAASGPMEQFSAVLLELKPVLPQIAQALTPTSQLFKNLLPVLAPLIPLFAEFGAEIVSVLVPAITTLAPVISDLAAKISQTLAPVVGILVGLLETLVPIFSQVFRAIVTTAVPVIQLLAQLIQQYVLPNISKFIPVIQQVAAKIGEWANQLGTILIPLIQGLGDLLKQVLPPIFQALGQALQFLLGVFEFVWPTIQAIVSGAINIIRSIVTLVLDLIHGKWGSILGDLVNIAKSVFGAILNIIGAALGSILHLILSKAGELKDAILKPFIDAKNAAGGILGSIGNALHIGGGGGHGAIAHAEGGWINEPVVGWGIQTGQVHTFAERGPELVVPAGRVSGVSSPTEASHTFNLYGVDPRTQAIAVANELNWRAKLRHG